MQFYYNRMDDKKDALFGSIQTGKKKSWKKKLKELTDAEDPASTLIKDPEIIKVN